MSLLRIFQRWQFILLAILIIVAAVDCQVIWFDSVSFWDDNMNVFKNPLYAPLSWEHIGMFWRGPYMELYLPVTYTVWGALVALSRYIVGVSISFGVIDPMVFHLTNLWIHLGSVGMVFLIFRKFLIAFSKTNFFKKEKPSRGLILAASTVGALLFGLHPVQVESVAWISCLRDLLGAFFLLVALFISLIWVEEKKSLLRKVLFFTSATLFFLLALGSKPGSVVLPVMVVLFWSVIDRAALLKGSQKYFLGIWFLMSFLFVGLTSHVQVSASLARSISPIWARPLIASDALAFSLLKIFVPIDLCADYGRSPNFVLEQGLLYWTWLLPITLGLFFICWKPARIFLLPYALLVIGITPTLGLIPFNFQLVSTVSDRYLYLAMIGPSLALALLILTVSSKKRIFIFTGLLLSVCTGLTLYQFPQWKNTENFCVSTLALNPKSWKTQHNYGLLLSIEGNSEEAIGHFQTAITLRPDRAEARNDFGLVYLNKGWAAHAVELFQQSLQLRPMAVAANNLALAYLMLNQPKKAIDAYHLGIKIDPEDLNLVQGLAWLLCTNPDASVRNGKEAVLLSKNIVMKTHGEVPLFILTLAAGLAEEGNFSEAIITVQQAVALFERVGDRQHIEEIKTMIIPAFQQKKALRIEKKIPYGTFTS